MSILSKMAADAPGAALGMASSLGIGAGIALGVSNSDATNSIFNNIYDSVVGRPGDGTMSADEVILGRRLDASSFINPWSRVLPGGMPEGVKYAKYALQPGPGVFNKNVMAYSAAQQSYDAGNYLQEEAANNYDQRVGNGNSPYTRNNASPYSGYKRYNRSQNLNASGDIVLGIHNGRHS